MTKFIPNVLLWLCLILFSGQTILAQDIPAKPVPPRLVNDFAGILTSDQINTLETKLLAYSDSTSTQIAVVIVQSLNGLDKADFATRIGQEWGVGKKGSDNGGVILIKPKTANEKGDVFIGTGYGMDASLTDAVINRITDLEMIPYFKNNDYYSGIDVAINRIMELSSGQYTSDQYLKGKKKSGSLVSLILVIVLIALFSGIFSRKKSQHHSIGQNLPWWMLLWGLGSMGSGNRGNWDDFSSGSGSFGGWGGGSGSGGFGGFGGGGFGGGGAGGSW